MPKALLNSSKLITPMKKLLSINIHILSRSIPSLNSFIKKIPKIISKVQDNNILIL